MAKQDDYVKAVRPKLKRSFLYILGNIIIWGMPLILGLCVLFGNIEEVRQAPTSIKVELWVLVVLVVMLFVYMKWGKIKLQQKIQEKNINAEKVGPVLTFANGVLALLPIIIGIIIFDFLSNLNEPITTFLYVLLGVEGFGRLLLLIDSFSEAQYK